MAEMNKIQSFKTFSQLKAEEKEIQLQEEAKGKREQLVTKIGETLAEMDITSFDELSEEQKKALVAKLFNEETKEVEQSAVTEAIKVEGKRDAKKVLTTYNKIFNKVLVDLGAMPTDSILGCIKYLMQEALHDANFHREAAPVSKLIKGNIKPLEIKMPGLGGHFVKIGPKTIKEILDKYYSDIANAAGWGGIGIVEGTALYLEQIKQEAMGQQVLNKFNTMFEGEEVRVDVEARINEAKVNKAKVLEVTEISVKEGNAFIYAAAKAKAEGKEDFEFNGKSYKVTLKKDTGLKESYQLLITEGTRSQVGKIDKNGNITSVYVHYDGYPDNMLPKVKKYDAKGVGELIKLGKSGISSLEAEIGKKHDFNNPTRGWTIFYGRDRGETNNMISKGNAKNVRNYLKDVGNEAGAEYVYLYDERDGQWYGANTYSDKDLKPVDQIEESVVLNEGTRGQFGKIDKAGNITSVYTHYDSYPENMLPIIKKSFKGGKNVDNVIDKGANSGLDADISKINFYNDGSINTTGSIKNIDNYLKDVDRDGGAEFVYLWDEKSKKWMMADIYGGSGLVPAFESVVNEAEIKSDDEFKEYAETVLKKAFGEDYDEAKAGEVIDGILSKSDGDYGAAVGMLTGSLGESVVAEANADGTISDDEDDDMDNLKSDVEFMTKELIDHIKKETERIGGQFRAPGYEAEAKKIVKSIMQKKKFKL